MQQIQERMGYTMGKVSTFASRLRELLDQKGLSQAQLSQLSVVSTKKPHNSGTQKDPESVENQCFRGFFHTFLSMMEKTISDCFIP